jgi:C-terminal processing protease CtpA/Prc
VGSRLSYQSGFEQNEASFAPRTLEHDLKRLEKQLEALDNDVVVSSSAAAALSKASAISLRAGATSMKGQKMMKKLVVMVPPGRLGVILTNHHDGHGTVVSEIRESSPLYHMLSPGDILIGVDDDDVTSMVVSQIISLMASRADRERRLTVITSIAQQ